MLTRGHNITQHWIPGHYHITGNEIAKSVGYNESHHKRTVLVSFSTSDDTSYVSAFWFKCNSRLLWDAPSNHDDFLHKTDPSLQLRTPRLTRAQQAPNFAGTSPLPCRSRTKLNSLTLHFERSVRHPKLFRTCYVIVASMKTNVRAYYSRYMSFRRMFLLLRTSLDH